MFEKEEDRMEAKPINGVGPGSIAQVTRDRKTLGSELRADLVFPSCLQPELEVAVALPPGNDPVVSDRLERAFLAGPHYTHPGSS